VQVLHSLPKTDHPGVLVGTETSDDAGVFRLRSDLAIINTVDFFTPIVDDPYTFGLVAAANALSDVYAMGGEPITAMNIVCFPKEKMDLQVLGKILKGGAEKVIEAGAVVIGGHSIMDPEIKYGMAVTGVVHPDRVLRNVGVQEGDALILTKALGTGIISTALKKGKAPKESIDEAIDSMTTLNKNAAAVLGKFPVHACSDITGYGLLGHTMEMATGSGVTLILESQKLPILHDAVRLANKGYLTAGRKRNREYLKDKSKIDSIIPKGLVEIALDPQTSGGLLIALPDKHAAKLVNELHSNGVAPATIVGHAVSLQKAWVRLA
jgi:selenide,water dikinase